MIESIARRLIRILPERIAFRLICRLAERITPLAMNPEQREAMRQAQRLSYGPGGRQVAWSWGEGPVVILVHGWGGRAAQMAPLALHLAAQGFRAVALDVTGHGSSPDRRSSWAHFIGDVAALSQALEAPVHAYIGHSAGGLALMAARTRHGIRAEGYVCICAPSFPYPPITAIGRRLEPPPALLQRYKDYIAAQFGADWSALEAGAAFADTGAELLLIHDGTDRYLDGRDAERILAISPEVGRLSLNGHGHQRILATPDLAQAVSRFLPEPRPQPLNAAFGNHNLR